VWAQWTTWYLTVLWLRCHPVQVLWTSIVEYLEMPRPEWIQKFPGQAVLNGSQLHWTKEIEEGVRANGLQGVKDVSAHCACVGAGEGVSVGVRVRWELQMWRFCGGGWCVGMCESAQRVWLGY
jgi:hypothetical protein